MDIYTRTETSSWLGKGGVFPWRCWGCLTACTCALQVGFRPGAQGEPLLDELLPWYFQGKESFSRFMHVMNEMRNRVHVELKILAFFGASSLEVLPFVLCIHWETQTQKWSWRNHSLFIDFPSLFFFLRKRKWAVTYYSWLLPHDSFSSKPSSWVSWLLTEPVKKAKCRLG